MMRRLAIVALFAAAAWTSARDYAQLVRDSLAQFRLPYEERRAFVLGGDYVTMRRLAQQVPRDARVAIVLRRPSDIDRGIFLNYYLYPRTTRIVTGQAPPGYIAILVDGPDMHIEP
jgi:hypothetical protein